MDQNGAPPPTKRERSPEHSSEPVKPDDAVFKKPHLPKRFRNTAATSAPVNQQAEPTSSGAAQTPEYLALMNRIITNTLTEADFKKAAELMKPLEFRNNPPVDLDSDDDEDPAPPRMQLPLTGYKPYDSEEEDVDSDGPPDEELDAEVARLTTRWEQNRLEEIQLKFGPEPTQPGQCPVEENTEDSSMNVDPDPSPIPSPAHLEVFLEEYLEEQMEVEKRNEVRKMEEERKLGCEHQCKLWTVLLNTLREIERRRKEKPPPCLKYFIVPEDKEVINKNFFNRLIYDKRNKREILAKTTEVVVIDDKLHFLRDMGYRWINRVVSRNPDTEPPCMLEYMQEFDGVTITHHRANQYDKSFSYAMIAYCEDPYWRVHDRIRNPNIVTPVLPRDRQQELDAEIGIEFAQIPADYRPPDNRPPIHIPPAAWALFRRLKREELERMMRENAEANDEPEEEVGGFGEI